MVLSYATMCVLFTSAVLKTNYDFGLQLFHFYSHVLMNSAKLIKFVLKNQVGRMVFIIVTFKLYLQAEEAGDDVDEEAGDGNDEDDTVNL